MLKRGQKKQKTFWQRIFYSQIVIVIGAVFIVIFSFGISKKMVHQNQINQDIDELLQEIDRLEKNNKEIETVINYLSTDDFLENEARTKLGLQKEGESVVIINDNYDVKTPKDNSKKTYQPSLPRSVSKSNPQKWLSYFFE